MGVHTTNCTCSAELVDELYSIWAPGEVCIHTWVEHLRESFPLADMAEISEDAPSPVCPRSSTYPQAKPERVRSDDVQPGSPIVIHHGDYLHCHGGNIFQAHAAHVESMAQVKWVWRK